jgi:hypothetical protein
MWREVAPGDPAAQGLRRRRGVVMQGWAWERVAVDICCGVSVARQHPHGLTYRVHVVGLAASVVGTTTRCPLGRAGSVCWSSEEACTAFRRVLLQLPGPGAATLLTSVWQLLRMCVCRVCRCSASPLHVHEQHADLAAVCALLQPAPASRLVGWLAGHSWSSGWRCCYLCEHVMRLRVGS